ncbi:MAG: alpha/beta hydrolase [Pseudomonadota bacterium]
MSIYELVEIPLPDGLKMWARRYGENNCQEPAICIPGLTRNAADFEDLAPKIAGTGRRVYAVSLRGRGPSDYDPDYHRYFPTTYRDDLIAALDHLAIERALLVGTSLGGIIAMLINENAPQRVSGAIINDVGPELAPEGIARIAGYVGEEGHAQDLNEAAARIRAINEVAFPDATEEDWRLFAKRTFREKPNGWVLDYDPKIAAALVENGPAPDLWPAFRSLNGKPTLLVHGEISDLLTPEIVGKMRAAHPNMQYVSVPQIGHAPFMTEPAAWDAIKAFLT